MPDCLPASAEDGSEHLLQDRRTCKCDHSVHAMCVYAAEYILYMPSAFRWRPTASLIHNRGLQLVRAGPRMFDDDEDEGDSAVATLEGGEGSGAGEEEYRAEYPNKLFVQETLEAFPDAAVATVEQARVSFRALSRLEVHADVLLILHSGFGSHRCGQGRVRGA